ncbi:MAG TPA: glycosyltransferase family 39 protein [Anaerolineales bacterium]|nr:glycosyltransferase family 39 protein [Anaerolineales bacterium]
MKDPRAAHNPREPTRLWTAIFTGGLIAGLILRFYLATNAQTPGHGDPAFYYTVAKNIVDGRGLVIDYVVYFFEGLVPLTHYSSDFWNPLTSILLSLPMRFLGKSVFNALLASIAISCIPALTAYLASRVLTGSSSAAACAGLLTFFAPYQIWVSVTTDANIFFGAFGALALYFAIRGFEQPRFFLIAAIGSGLAQFTRQDGILLLLALEASILFARISWKQKIYLCSGAAGIHLAVLSPLLIGNYLALGTLFPRGPASTMFLTTYEDFHAYGKTFTWQTYRAAWGLKGILDNKLHVAMDNIRTLNSFLNPVLTVLTVVGLADLALIQRKMEKNRFLLPILFFAGLEYCFYSFIASFSGPGSLPKSLAILIPFIAVVIFDLFRHYLRAMPLFIAAAIALTAYAGYAGYSLNYQYNSYYNTIYRSYASIREIIARDAGHRPGSAEEIVVMARDVWDVYEGVGYKAVMIPNNDLDTIYFVARHYDAEYLILPAPRQALQPIYSGARTDPRFILIANVPNSDLKLFRIQAGP